MTISFDSLNRAPSSGERIKHNVFCYERSLEVANSRSEKAMMCKSKLPILDE